MQSTNTLTKMSDIPHPSSIFRSGEYFGCHGGIVITEAFFHQLIKVEEADSMGHLVISSFLLQALIELLVALAFNPG